MRPEQEARAALVSVLKGRRTSDWCPFEERLAGHIYTWHPPVLFGMAGAGTYRVACFYGCGYEKEVTLDGTEVWVA